MLRTEYNIKMVFKDVWREWTVFIWLWIRSIGHHHLLDSPT
jgi:hypothetical protein